MPYTKSADTQAYLNEAKTPSVQTFLQLRNALQGFIVDVSRAAQQGDVYREISQSAEFTESDPDLIQYYDAVQRHCATISRVTAEIVRAMRQLKDAEQNLRDTNLKIRARADELNVSDNAGYTA